MNQDIINQHVVELRSDTFTMPTKEMREEIFKAEVGDSIYNEDPTMNGTMKIFLRYFFRPRLLKNMTNFKYLLLFKYFKYLRRKIKKIIYSKSLYFDLNLNFIYFYLIFFFFIINR